MASTLTDPKKTINLGKCIFTKKKAATTMMPTDAAAVAISSKKDESAANISAGSTPSTAIVVEKHGGETHAIPGTKRKRDLDVVEVSDLSAETIEEIASDDGATAKKTRKRGGRGGAQELKHHPKKAIKLKMQKDSSEEMAPGPQEEIEFLNKQLDAQYELNSKEKSRIIALMEDKKQADLREKEMPKQLKSMKEELGMTKKELKYKAGRAEQLEAVTKELEGEMAGLEDQLEMAIEWAIRAEESP